jgi:hypothetical protein
MSDILLVAQGIYSPYLCPPLVAFIYLTRTSDVRCADKVHTFAGASLGEAQQWVAQLQVLVEIAGGAEGVRSDAHPAPHQTPATSVPDLIQLEDPTRAIEASPSSLDPFAPSPTAAANHNDQTLQNTIQELQVGRAACRRCRFVSPH